MGAGLDKVVRYYSFCLTDAQAGRASITKAVWGRLPYRRLGTETLTENRLAGGPTKPNKNDDTPSLSRADIDAWLNAGSDWLPLVWHPLIFERSSSVRHGIQTHQWAPDILAPISILIYAHRDGRIVVVGRPRFSRECLEPRAPSFSDRWIAPTSSMTTTRSMTGYHRPMMTRKPILTLKAWVCTRI